MSVVTTNLTGCFFLDRAFAPLEQEHALAGHTAGRVPEKPWWLERPLEGWKRLADLL